MRLTHASGVRRILAVFIDFVVFFGLWIGFGTFLQAGSVFATVTTFLLADLVLTALFGLTAGRLLTGIRVVRRDGGAPGIKASAVRMVLVMSTGIFGWLVWVRRSSQDKTTPELWWDRIAGTYIVRSAPAEPEPADPRSAALAGFRLHEADLAANSAGRLSGRQRLRTMTRAAAYMMGFAVSALTAVGCAVALRERGFSVDGLTGVVAGPLIAIGLAAYAWQVWRDALDDRVLAIDGVPQKRVQRNSLEGGFAWKLPCLDLEGEHKLGWRAFRSIHPDLRYRLYVLPVSGRCVAAVPID